MQYFFRVLFLLIGLLIINIGYADSHKENKVFLKHCNKAGTKAKGNLLILNAEKNNTAQSDWVYILHNTSKKPVYINHPADHPGTASAGWGTRLNPHQWSALMLNRPAFAITCQNSLANNQHAIVSCKKVLQICRFKPLKLSKNKQGSFWIGENQSLDKLLQTFKVRGVNWE